MDGFEKYKPGEIIKYYMANNEILVKYKKGSVLIKEYSGEIMASGALEHKNFCSINCKYDYTNYQGW